MNKWFLERRLDGLYECAGSYRPHESVPPNMKILFTKINIQIDPHPNPKLGIVPKVSEQFLFNFDNLWTQLPLSRQCGILNISQPYRHPRPVKGASFTFFFYRDNYFCSFVCCVLFERGVIFCDMCTSVLRLIVVPLPPRKNPFADH
jgi:hypothetical protein